MIRLDGGPIHIYLYMKNSQRKCISFFFSSLLLTHHFFKKKLTLTSVKLSYKKYLQFVSYIDQDLQACQTDLLEFIRLSYISSY